MGHEFVTPTPLLRAYRPPVAEEPGEPWEWPTLPTLTLPSLPPPPPFQTVAETLGFPVNPFTPTELVRSHRSYEEQTQRKTLLVDQSSWGSLNLWLAGHEQPTKQKKPEKHGPGRLRLTA